VGEQTVVAYQRELLPLMMKATGPILVQTVTMIRRFDHVADRTGKPARSLPDGKQMKRISATEAGDKLRAPSP
jgi:hypothetical protein